METTNSHSGRALVLRAYGEHRFLLLVIVAALALLAVTLVLSAEEADAWTTTDYAGVEGDFYSGEAQWRYTSFTSGGSVSSFDKDSHTTPYIRYYRYIGSSYSYYYYDRAYFGVKIGDMDDSTHVNRAWLYVRVGYEVNFDDYMAVRMLKMDARNSGAAQTYDGIHQGHYLGSVYVSSTGTWSFAITGSALTALRGHIAGDDSHVYFGFYGNSASGDYIRVDPSASHLRLEYDASPPNTPSLNALGTYNSGTRVRLTWSTTTDAPAGGNVGMHSTAYEIGIFDYPSHSPVRTTGWFDGTQGNRYLYNFADGQTYYFKLRARDASGIVSAWSYEAWTTIDDSAPSQPIMRQEPMYTSGTSNVIEWTASTDAGIGVSYYSVQRASDPDFGSAITYSTSSTSSIISGLSSGMKYYYRVAAIDAYLHISGWSVPQSTTQDNDAPTLPVLMAEPLYTVGTSNTFAWHPSTDAGVGVQDYQAQVGTDPLFTSIVMNTHTTDTFVTAPNLQDGEDYYCRVRARDHFGTETGWSSSVHSVQDDSGPGPVGLAPLPEYSPLGAVKLVWDGAMDGGVGVGWYYVEHSSDGVFPAEDSVDNIVGLSVSIPDLSHNETWFFRVAAVDRLGNVGQFTLTNTTIDGEAPTEPGLTMPEMFTSGDMWTLGWTPATDDLSGVDHYLVKVYARPTGGMVFTDETNATSLDVPGLADGATYWAHVIAVDAAGNTNTSAMVSTTMDASPPTVPQLGMLLQFSPGTEVDIGWLPSTDAGIGGNEYMVEWAYDPSFDVRAGYTGWMTTTTYHVESLSDGQSYWFRVTARDNLGQGSLPSALVMTTMDASPPGIPVMVAMDAFVPGPMVPVMWGPVTDGSGMPVVYQVMAWDSDEAGALPVATSPWLMDTRYTFMGLDADTEHWFMVMSKDHLDWTSDPSSAVSTTIDTAGPSVATIDELQGFTAGTGFKVTWVAGTDDGVGGVVCRLVVYSDEDVRILVHSSEWTNVGEASVYGLADGATYWFVVEGRDGFLNMGEASQPATTTMDASAPTVMADGELFGPIGDITGTCTDAASGVDTVEVSSDGTTWLEATVSGGTWSASINDLSDGKVWVRASDIVGNMASAHVLATVDITAPTVSITSPTSGADVSSAVVITGSVADVNLHGYSVDYQRSGSSDWTTVQPEQMTTGVNGVLATWLTAGLTGGDHVLRVTATDEVGLEKTATVTVTLKGAKLSIGPTDISFSDTHPLPDETVTVMVTVRNTGDSPAEGVTVTVYDNGKAVGEESGVTVPAHGTATVAVKTKATEGAQEFTARASSDLYDTGDMGTGTPLKTIDREGALENVGGILGLVALIIALLALVLVLMMKMGDKGGHEPVEEPEEQIVLDPIVDEPVLMEEPPQGM